MVFSRIAYNVEVCTPHFNEFYVHFTNYFHYDYGTMTCDNSVTKSRRFDHDCPRMFSYTHSGTSKSQLHYNYKTVIGQEEISAYTSPLANMLLLINWFRNGA